MGAGRHRKEEGRGISGGLGEGKPQGPEGREGGLRSRLEEQGRGRKDEGGAREHSHPPKV